VKIHRCLFERSLSSRSSIEYREILDGDGAPILDRIEVSKAFLGDPAPDRILIVVATDPVVACQEVSER
jgi:hypothetical protein